MKYHFGDDGMGLTLGSLDLETFKGTLPKVKQHIFLREKAPWVEIPDDGAERLELFAYAEQMGIE